MPHEHFSQTYGVEVKYAEHLDAVPDEDLKTYSIIQFLRNISLTGRSEELVKRCKSAGCKVVFDIDDYWEVPKSHAFYLDYAKYNIPQQTIEAIKLADVVTTTTEYFADKIKPFNSNVEVLPNAIWDTQEQFKLKPVESKRVRIGYITANHHTEDVKLIANGIKEVYKDVAHNKFQICLGGYYVQDKLDYVNDVLTKEQDEETIKRFKFYKMQLESGNDVPNKMIWNNYYGNIPHFMLYEFIMTYGGKYLNTRLQKDLEQPNYNGQNEVYTRLYGRSANEYATLYNFIDVALVPLKEDTFSSCKSQLKIIEAGWFKKAVIVSNVKPYTFDCNKSNSILVDKNINDWGTAIKAMIHNTSRREDLAEALHEHVKANYSMDKVNTKRKQIYDRLCQ
jgi:glycosyltransferase involved in cell wall biosynthesis